MDKKLLMKVGIGAGVLVLGFLAYKKFVAKPKDTKSAEATNEEETAVEEETKAEPTKAESKKAEPTKVEPTKPTATAEPIKVEKKLKVGAITKTALNPQTGDKMIMKVGSKKISGLGKKLKKYAQLDESEIQKYGLTQSDYEKLKDETIRIFGLQKENTKLTSDEKRAQRYDVLRKFGKENNLNAEGYIKYMEDSRARIAAKQAEEDMLKGKTSFADFMDFDGNDDVQGSIM